MLTFIMWLILLFLCWPLALAALILYPIIWLLLLPFKIIGISVNFIFEFIRSIITLPFRILRGPSAIK